jgi:3-methyladenine DNA glycosylase AlkC
MAKKFKDYYDHECAELLSGKLVAVRPQFQSESFIEWISSRLDGKEFTERQDLFADAFEKFMTGSYDQDISLFTQILGPELKTTTGMFTYGWWLWPIGRYVERHGTKNIPLSIDFIYELTKRFTGEFAIRPIIATEPESTLKIILKWSRDENVHVRRLASEGLRPRLPWASKSLAAVEKFELYKEILTNLRHDKEKFVQKSVGNNLNDLMKEKPGLAKLIISEWEQDHPSKETLWIIKHGLRRERKKMAK